MGAVEGRLSGILLACEKGTFDPLPSTSTVFFSPPITEAHPGVSPCNCSQGPECDDNERVSKISLPDSGFPKSRLVSWLQHSQKNSNLT